MFALRCDYDDERVNIEFQQAPSGLSDFFNHMLVLFDERYKWLVGTTHLARWATYLSTSAEALGAKIRHGMGGDDINPRRFGAICMFLDGLFGQVRRPGGAWEYQRSCYSGHKRAHGIHFLATVLSNGICPWFWCASKYRLRIVLFQLIDSVILTSYAFLH
jgi:hypothetical protein